MNAKIVNNLGTITISTGVIATIAGIIATRCYGVVEMVPSSATDNIARAFRRDPLTRGIKVQVAEDGLAIEVYITVEYGTNIQAVSNSIIEGVKYQVEMQTGFVVNQVTVNVESVRVD